MKISAQLTGLRRNWALYSSLLRPSHSYTLMVQTPPSGRTLSTMGNSWLFLTKTFMVQTSPSFFFCSAILSFLVASRWNPANRAGQMVRTIGTMERKSFT